MNILSTSMKCLAAAGLITALVACDDDYAYYDGRPGHLRQEVRETRGDVRHELRETRRDVRGALRNEGREYRGRDEYRHRSNPVGYRRSSVERRTYGSSYYPDNRTTTVRRTYY